MMAMDREEKIDILRQCYYKILRINEKMSWTEIDNELSFIVVNTLNVIWALEDEKYKENEG